MIDRNLELIGLAVLRRRDRLRPVCLAIYDDDGAERSFLRALSRRDSLPKSEFTASSLPSLAPAFPSVALAKVLARAPPARTRVAASAGYEEPSLVFLAGTATRLTDAAGAADFLRGGTCRFAFIEAREQHAFALRAEAIGLRYKAGPRIDGFNISSGRSRSTIAVFQSAGAP